MRQILSTATQAQPIVIIQGAYQSFYAQGTIEMTAYGANAFNIVLAAPAVVAIAGQDTWIKFQGLVDAWRQQRGAKSSITEAVLCPAYQSILGMGPDVVPFLLKQLRSEGENPDHWFWALKAITEADPVPNEDRGDLKRMARAWLEWELRQGYGW